MVVLVEFYTNFQLKANSFIANWNYDVDFLKSKLKTN